MFLVFFLFAYLQIFSLYSTLEAPKEETVQYMEKYIEQNEITYERRGEQFYNISETNQKQNAKIGIV